MIRVQTQEPTSAEWVDWRNRCKAEHAALHTRFTAWKDTDEDKPKPGALYSEHHKTLAEIFNYKCAYCEAPFAVGNRKGQLDHYRPKQRVKTRSGALVTLKWGCVAAERPHPGYYWLAYEWQNLLPVCSACNLRTKDFEGASAGKSDFFPMASDGRYASGPDDMEEERPLLLNPWVDDPARHMVFSPFDARIGALDDRAEATIDLLGLNAEPLRLEREKVCDEVIRKFQEKQESRAKQLNARPQLKAALAQEILEINSEFAQWRQGKGSFSAFRAATLDYCEEQWRQDPGAAA